MLPLGEESEHEQPAKGENVEAYAIKTTFRWSLLDEFMIVGDAERFDSIVFFTERSQDDPTGSTLEFVNVSVSPDWENDAPDLEPNIEEL